MNTNNEYGKWFSYDDCQPPLIDTSLFVVDLGKFKSLAYWVECNGYLSFVDINSGREFYSVKQFLRLPK